MQNQTFNDLEGLRIAAEMERRGEEFYRRAAKIARTEPTRQTLSQLAAEESVHYREFQRLYEQQLAQKEKTEAYDPEVSAYLSAIAADIVFPGGLMQLAGDGGLEDPGRILLSAIASEKDSILFYTEMKEHVREQEVHAVFEEIVRQERQHLHRLQNMLLAL